MMYFPILTGYWEKNVQIREGPVSQPSSSMRELLPQKKLAGPAEV